MTPSQQLKHAQTFEETLKLLNTVRKAAGSEAGKWSAVAIIHAAVFYLGRHEPRRDTYNWLQTICDDLVTDREKW